MRPLRLFLLIVLLVATTGAVGAVVREPLEAGWRALGIGEASRRPAADLADLLTGACALLAALAWIWLLTAVACCTWVELHAGPTRGVEGPTVWRPSVVRVLVATWLGMSALTIPAAQAQPPTARSRSLPDDPTSAAVSPTTPRLLDGLPVPDRATGGVGHGVGHRVSTGAAVLTIEVAQGDSLWSLTADLLPAGTPLSAVAEGWRLLYAANRDVVGLDPDLLQPGQRLHVDAALEELVTASRADRAPRRHQPVPHHAGGSR